MKNFEIWLVEQHPEFIDEGWKDWAKKGVLAATLGASTLAGMNQPAQADPSDLPQGKPT
jgi:phytoene dehydrogenase-like protein